MENSMANHNTPDPPNPAAPRERRSFQDTRSIGPSDSSDSGSDLAGIQRADFADSDETSDAEGTGERQTVGEDAPVRIGSDIGLHRIVGPDEAGLGGGLDQAEEAQLGITDEEISELIRTRSPK
jgi:hypothetical protein